MSSTMSSTIPQSNTTLATARANVDALSAHLNAMFFEREAVVDALITALIAGEHVALYGPPGVAKSAIVEEANACITGSKYFNYLMTRFTEPSEVFGAVDINAFKNTARQVRNVSGMLPDVEVAFLDEAFKANSAILNSLLRIVNERQFNNGGSFQPVPLRTLFMASNEIPTDTSLGALWDRALLRLSVKGMQDDASWEAFMFGPRYSGARPTVSMADFDVLRQYGQSLAWSDGAKKAYRAIRDRMTEKGIECSDRRWGKSRDIICAYAALRGATSEIDDSHVEVLKWVIWSKLDQIPVVETMVEECCAQWLGAYRAVQSSLDVCAGEMKTGANLPFTQRFKTMGVVLEKINKAKSEVDDLAKKVNKPEVKRACERAATMYRDCLDIAQGKSGKIGG